MEETKHLINLITFQQDKINQLEKDRDDLLTGHRVLLTYINTQDDKIMALNKRWVEIHSNRGQK